MRSVLIVFGLVACANPASAQWYVTAFLGDAATSSTRLEILSQQSDTSLAVDPVRLADESFASPVYYGARLTRGLGRPSWLGLEVEFIHSKAIADTAQLVRAQGRLDGRPVDADQRLDAILPRFELSHGLNFLLGNVVFDWPLSWRSEALVAIVGRLGTGLTIPHVESTFRGHDEDDYQLGGMAFAAAIGAQIRLSKRLSAVVDVKVTRTRQHVEVGTADEGTFTTRHVVAGVAWRATSGRHQPFIR